ncbi:hypothetical protein ACFVYP_02695 [Kitasatospora sp. NPDC058201]
MTVPPGDRAGRDGRAAADTVCRSSFGAGRREAEHHDGHYGPDSARTGGRTFRAYGTIPDNTRFRVAIDDQPANPWN